jgi:hypothetical protein
MNIMKNTVLKSFIMLGFFFGITSCSEKDEQPESHEAKLPEITFEGRQFIACYVNEEPFVSVPQGGIGMNSKPDAAIYSDSILYIRGTGNEQMRRANIGLAMIYKEGQRLYPLNFKYANYRTRFTDNSSLGGKQLQPYSRREPHQMEILYEDDNIIAGTFYFTAVSEDGDTVRITDGRYDLKKGL